MFDSDIFAVNIFYVLSVSFSLVSISTKEFKPQIRLGFVSY